MTKLDEIRKMVEETESLREQPLNIVVVDYPDLVISKKITEEGRKNIRMMQKFMNKFIKKNNVSF